MKILGICGSPRKRGNTAELVRHALDGAAAAGAETRFAHLYDYEFKGCLSCYSCKKPQGGSFGRCAVRDALRPLLEEALSADGLVLGSPVYYGAQSGVMRCFLERLLYPLYPFADSKTLNARPIPSVFVYTMAAPLERAESEGYMTGIERIRLWLEQLLVAPSRVLLSCETMHQEDYAPFGPVRFDVEARRVIHAENFPEDCRRAGELGASLAGA